ARPTPRHGQDLHPSRAARAPPGTRAPKRRHGPWNRRCSRRRGGHSLVVSMRSTSAAHARLRKYVRSSETTYSHGSYEAPGGFVNHRHLLPEEIDLLLDGELGFAVSPFKAHVRDCAEVRA